MHPPGADVVLLRHGEVGVKSDQVRRKMEGRLADNVAALLASRDVDGSVERARNRIYVHTDRPEAATDVVTDAFGVVSASPVLSVEPTLEAILDAMERTTRRRFEGGSFAVSARRAGGDDVHAFTSQDLETDGGNVVWKTIESMDCEPVVDLDDPDFELHVECRPDRASVFLEKRDGPGGLPLGTQTPLVALVSGGIDSPVAAWSAMCRGCPVYPVYVDLGEYGGVDHRARAVATVEALAAHAPNFDWNLRVVPAGEVVAALVESVDAERMLVLRRFMVAAAAAIARKQDAAGVVTGEAIGQKSSQTSANVAVTDTASELPVHRPNLTRDKTEITAMAREIGTFDESTIDAGCNRVAPSHPETRADLPSVRRAEPDDLLERAREAASRAERVSIDP